MSYNGNRTCIDVFSRLQIAVMLYSIYRGKSSGNRVAWSDSKGEYDDYEMDNFSETARPILLNEIQKRNFNQQYYGDGVWGQCDVDWVRFVPICNQTFDIQTFAMSGKTNADTRLTVFNNALSQLAQNDDISGSNHFSKITISLLGGQTYFIRVENMSANVTGYYNLSVDQAFTINGPNSFCTTSNTYSVSNLPAGATVTWSTPSGLVTINTPNATQTTLTKTGNGIITLTAAISNACGGSPVVISKSNIVVGTGVPISGTYNSPSSPIEAMVPFTGFDLTTFNASCIAFNTNMSANGAGTISWAGPSGGDVYWLQSGDNVFVSFSAIGQTIVLTATATNSCGSTLKKYRFKCTTTTSCGIQPLRVILSPNPAFSTMNISLVHNNPQAILQPFQKIRIIDKLGNVKQNKQYSAGTKNTSVNLAALAPDVYTLQVFDGQSWYSEKFVKK